MSLEPSENSADLSTISSVILPSPEPSSELMPRQADNDEQVIELRLHGRPVTTQRAYRSDVAKLLQHLGKKLQVVSLGDLQSFIDSLTGKPSSIRRAANSVKSLMAFGFKLGYLRFDVGRALRLQPSRDELAERILSETDVLRILAPIHLVQTSLGHVSIATTGKYLHARPSDSSGNFLPAIG